MDCVAIVRQFYVDFNSREFGDPGTVPVHLDELQLIRADDREDLQINERIVVESEDLRCEGVVRRKVAPRSWIADVDFSTMTDVPESE
jgi:hypothetical protein